MKNLYKHRDTSEYYVVKLGANRNLFALDGSRQMVLTQPEKVINKASGRLVAQRPGVGQLVVTALEFADMFELVVDCTWEPNNPIDELMARYTEECCDFEDAQYLAICALRFVDVMEDCHQRCILFAMAKKLAPHLLDEPEGTLKTA
jgi:hypothetical protein